ncbi:MAG: ammonium transporter, partial [Cytophagales bacterium]
MKDEQVSTDSIFVEIPAQAFDSLAFYKQKVIEKTVYLDSLSQKISSIEIGLHENAFTTNNLWMLMASILVFIMHLGFATLESGLTRAKNASNILFKNTLIPALGITMFAFCGFNLMYPSFNESDLGVLAFKGFGMIVPSNGETLDFNKGMTYWTSFLFQAMFCATSVTIVSGAVAERINLLAFLIFAFVFVSLVYPIIGSWSWGEGWLFKINFFDFAGSTVVHLVGGAAALAGTLVLGPRLGKFQEGKIYPIPGHNMTSATIGAFMLWLGWYGFNGGSVLTAHAGDVSRVFLTTTLAACSGALFASITIFGLSKTFDLSMTLNGILAGLVGITASANLTSPLDAFIIGAVSGVLVVFSVLAFDKLRIDDPVGALSVHMVCGLWGTLAVGIFGEKT